MINPTSDKATSWRDLAGQLTPNQLSLLESAEQRADRPAELLESARECVWSNTEQAKLDARLAHIAVPAGSTTDGWSSIRATDGDALRGLEWATFDTARVHVSIDGFQDESGAVTKGISLYAKTGGLDELSVPDVRELVQSLTAAADELERLQ